MLHLLHVLHILLQQARVERLRLGITADFCPICRGIQTFQFFRLTLTRHIMGSFVADTIGYRNECGACGFERAVAENHLPAIWPPTKALPESTMEEAARVHAGRLALERRRERSEVGPEERARLLREPFLALKGMALDATKGWTARALAKMSPKVKGFILLLGALSFLAIGAALSFAVPYRKWDGGPNPKVIGFPVMAGGAILLVSSVLLLAAPEGRRVREAVYPLLARALKPLAPSPAELESILQEQRAAGRAIGRYLRADLLVKKIGS